MKPAQLGIPEGFCLPSHQDPPLVISVSPAPVTGTDKCVLNKAIHGFQNCQSIIGSPLLWHLDFEMSTSGERLLKTLNM